MFLIVRKEYVEEQEPCWYFRNLSEAKSALDVAVRNYKNYSTAGTRGLIPDINDGDDDNEFEYAIVFREKKTANSYSFIDEFELQISKLEQKLLEKEAKILLLENEVKTLTEAHYRYKYIFSVIENNNLIPKFITESEYKKDVVKAIAYAEINESLSIVYDEDNRKVKLCIFIPHENRFKDCK